VYEMFGEEIRDAFGEILEKFIIVDLCFELE
jgi:hypothetical protein